MKFNVLIVEDDILSASYLRKIIELDNDYKVVAIAQNRKEALTLLKDKKVAIVFIDIVLNNKASGIQLAIDISKEYPDIIIIFATAHSDKKMIEDATKANAFSYLLKPYRPDEIGVTLTFIKERLKSKIEKSSKLPLIDGYTFDFINNCLCKNDKEIPLTKEELTLIKLLAKQHTVLDRDSILKYLNISNDALRALIYRIRNSTTKELIKSYKRFGYKLAMA